MSSNYATDATVVAVPQSSANSTSTTAGAATTGSKILGTAERAAGHMLPLTDLGHQMKADGARLKGNEAKAQKAEAHMDHGVHESVTTGSYLLGEAERAAGHMLPGLDAGHRLKAEGAMHKGDIQKAERAASHIKGAH
ncbi:hypothetical protein HDU88_008465 [Geranomyces variabilis]|nr:hypothetical protein HDU88_008465 [Geranomyces variabilis]